MSSRKPSLETVEQQIKTIFEEKTSSIQEKIEKLTALHSTSGEIAVLKIENAIEDVFGEELRRLNSIREENIEKVDIRDIEALKDGFAVLFSTIDNTLQWNPEKQSSMEGVINRASLRAMLIDPSVSIKTKEKIMNNWEDYM
ncbi:MAG: hypothetical protein ACFFD4_33445 [Candidatus Odinarchaeota archaeon]